jgi:hypothetical protein
MPRVLATRPATAKLRTMVDRAGSMRRFLGAALFMVGTLFGVFLVPALGDLRDQFTPAKRVSCVPRSAICIGEPLRSIDVNRAETGLIFLGALHGGDDRSLSALVHQATETDRVVLRFQRGKRITRVSVEGGRVVALLEEPDITLP